jgi:PAS domain-containing protein
MSKPAEPPAAQPHRITLPLKSGSTDSDEGWKSAAQTQRLLHELRVHQVELEMQNEELRVSRADVEVGLKRYTELYDFAPVGYVTLSPEGSLRELNLPAARLLGRERSRLVGGRLRSFVSPATLPAFDSWLANLFAQRETQTCDVVLLRDDRPPVSVRLEARLSFDGQSGRAVLTDISARKAIVEELGRVQKLELGDQLAFVAHDFNGILSAVIENLAALQAEAESPAEDDAALHSLETLFKRGSSLCASLLERRSRTAAR